MHVTLETIPDTEDGSEHISMNPALLHNTIYASMMARSRERLNTPPALPEPNSRSSSFQTPSLMSSSPPSSLDSSIIPSMEISSTLEAHLRHLPSLTISWIECYGLKRLLASYREISGTYTGSSTCYWTPELVMSTLLQSSGIPLPRTLVYPPRSRVQQSMDPGVQLSATSRPTSNLPLKCPRFPKG